MKQWQYGVVLGLFVVAATACSSGSGEESNRPEQPANAEGKTVVTWSVQQPSPFYQTVEKKFETKYPDIDLQIKVTEDYEQYQKNTNTEILSGKGPDIFEISGLPIEDYENKNLLLNMGELMEQDATLDQNDLQMNVLNALKSQDGLYAMPIGFNLRAFVGDGAIVRDANIDDRNWNWKQFEDLSREWGEKGTDRRYAMAGEGPDYILSEMIVDKYKEFVDPAAKKAMFDSPSFVDTMQGVKQMYDRKVMTSEMADEGKQMFYSVVLRSPADFIDSLYRYSSDPMLLRKPEQSGGTRIVPATEFAIQARSPAREEAWKLVTFLLSEDGQALQDREGLSLLKSVNEKRLSEIQKQVNDGTYKTSDGKSPKVPDEAFAAFKAFINSADNYADVDGKVVSIVGEESLAFFNGQKTAEEAAKLIQNRVTTLLNE